jgi:hypothetical protein
MDNRRRVTGAVLCVILILLSGWMTLDIITRSCAESSENECEIFWIMGVASLGAGILSVEIIVARQKAIGKWYAIVEDRDKNEVPTLSARQVWLRSISRVLLATLLGGLPVFVLGAFGLAVFGTLTGFFLYSLVRIALNRIAPIKEGIDS